MVLWEGADVTIIAVSILVFESDSRQSFELMLLLMLA